MDDVANRRDVHVSVIGAGVAGLVCAVELVHRGAKVEIYERAEHVGASSCSWAAGGMLAPWCERESADVDVMTRGAMSLTWWTKHFQGTVQRGTLVVAGARDVGELVRFARRTEHFTWIDAQQIAALEPDLDGRFRRALLFGDEGHLDPRSALAALVAALERLSVPFHFGAAVSADSVPGDYVVDCRGVSARDMLTDLRGVRGEMVMVQSTDIRFSRPVRLLHPRTPLYVVPRGAGRFMLGASLLESDDRGPPTVRSVVELLNGAYALHPNFGEAQLIEISAEVRPAFPSNLPRLTRRGRTISLNGLYRHGFLLAPSLACEAADEIFGSSVELVA